MKKTTKAAPVKKSKAKQLLGTSGTLNDLRNSGLIISVLINLFVLCLWLVLLLTDRYDSALAHFFLGR